MLAVSNYGDNLLPTIETNNNITKMSWMWKNAERTFTIGHECIQLEKTNRLFYHFTFVLLLFWFYLLWKIQWLFYETVRNREHQRCGLRLQSQIEKRIEWEREKKCAQDYSSHHSFISSFLWVPRLFCVCALAFPLFPVFLSLSVCYSSTLSLSLLLLLSLKSTVLRLLLEWSAHQRFSHWKFFLQMVSL